MAVGAWDFLLFLVLPSLLDEVSMGFLFTESLIDCLAFFMVCIKDGTPCVVMPVIDCYYTISEFFMLFLLGVPVYLLSFFFNYLFSDCYNFSPTIELPIESSSFASLYSTRPSPLASLAVSHLSLEDGRSSLFVIGSVSFVSLCLN